MADKKITQLTNITGANLVDADEFVVVDISADETKAITLGELKEAFDSGSGFVRITGDTMTGALDVQSTITADGLTVDGDARLDGGSSGSDTYLRFTESFAAIQNAGFYLHLDGADDDLYIGRHDTADTNVANDKPVIGIDRGTGDISFYEDTGTTPKFFWDASAESLGIGTSSPRTALDVAGRTTTDNATVGSGTASTYVDLTVNGASTANYGPMIELQSAGTAFGKITNYGRVQGGTSTDMFVTTATTNNLILGTNNAERMRIDSSGNLLVGKTSSSGSTQGAQLQAAGNVFATASNDYPLYLNRLGSDGQLAQFRKDNTLVGSIGVEGGDLTIGDAGAGLQFRGIDPCIRPHNMTTNSPSDNAVDLGRYNTRFRDIHLSGGVVFGDAGGSGSATSNKFDSYEYGTFTPTYGSSGVQPSGITYDNVVGNEGIYVKNGRAVFVQINMRTDAVTSVGTGSLYISGLPFSTPNLSSQGGVASFYIGSSGQFATNQPTSAQMGEVETNILLFYRTSSNGDTVSMTTSELQNLGNTNFIRLSGVYYTTD